MRHLFWVTQLFFYYFCDMFIRKKKNRSGSTSVIVVEKNSNKYKEHITIGISSDKNEIEGLVEQGKEWVRKYQSRHYPELDLYGEETEAKRKEEEDTQAFLSNIENILVNGDQLILDRIFDKVGFNQIEDDVFRRLVQSRLSCPSSKAATVISTRMWICRRYTAISTSLTIPNRRKFRISAYITQESYSEEISV